MKTDFNTQVKPSSWKISDKNASGETTMKFGGTTWKEPILPVTLISLKIVHLLFTEILKLTGKRPISVSMIHSSPLRMITLYLKKMQLNGFFEVLISFQQLSSITLLTEELLIQKTCSMLFVKDSKTHKKNAL